MDLFDFVADNKPGLTSPLAVRMRPVTLDEFAGQDEIIGPEKFLRRMIESDNVPSLIFFGPPGTGKTSLINLIVADHTAQNGITFYCKDHLSVFMQGLKIFREVEPDRPMLCLFEDIEELIRYNGTRQLLGLLDGENNINHCISQ